MTIHVVADSTCDLPAELIERHHIHIVPLLVSFGEETYKDGVTLSTETLYEKVAQYGKLPKTAAPSPADFENVFRPYVEQGDQVIYVGLSSALSSTFQSAKIAQGEFPEGSVEIVDSRNLSTGIGLLVMKAVDYVEQGMSLKEVAAGVQALIDKVETEFVIDTLDYLHMGGRCSGTQAFFGSLLKIHPVVKVVDGSMILVEKLRGKHSKVIDELLSRAIKNSDRMRKERIFVTHSRGLESAQYLKQQLQSALGEEANILISEAGTVISSHCGPNTVGILYISE